VLPVLWVAACVSTAIRVDRGLAYEQLGQHGRARADLERVYATDPTFEDVRDRLAALDHA
jgi:regulator of sirC expression with transglutaminase-like and TPR domain